MAKLERELKIGSRRIPGKSEKQSTNYQNFIYLIRLL